MKRVRSAVEGLDAKARQRHHKTKKCQEAREQRLRARCAYIPPALAKELGRIIPRSKFKSEASVFLPPLEKGDMPNVPEVFVPLINWARAFYGCNLPWKHYVNVLITMPREEDMPFDAFGHYMDDDSADALDKLFRDLKCKYAREGFDQHGEWFMMLFFRAWFMLPRQAGKYNTFHPIIVDGSELQSRLFIKGDVVKVPHIVLHISAECEIIVAECTLVHSEFRIVRCKLRPNERHINRDGATEYVPRTSYAITTANLPVYRGKARRLHFGPDIREHRRDFGPVKNYKLTGMAALAAWMLDDGVHAREDDDVHAIIAESGRRVEQVVLELQVDLTLTWDTKKRKIVSVHGDHADPETIYHVLLIGEGVSNHHGQLYTMHRDAFRNPGEATGLDLNYRNMFITGRSDASMKLMKREPLRGFGSPCCVCGIVDYAMDSKDDDDDDGNTISHEACCSARCKKRLVGQ